MSDRDAEQGEDADDPPADGADAPGVRPPPRLRRGLFGYRRSDVEGALSSRADELAELRQDVAALWLAFAQHDRMIRESIEAPRPAAPQPPTTPPPPDRDAAGNAPPPPAPPATERAAQAPAEAPTDAPPSVGSQLSDLDDVLAAIEKATNTLERTYAEEIAAPPPESSADPEAADRGAQSDDGADEAQHSPDPAPGTDEPPR